MYLTGYTPLMNTFEETALLARWFIGLWDTKAKVGIARRLDNARHGNFGDCEPVG